MDPHPSGSSVPSHEPGAEGREEARTLAGLPTFQASERCSGILGGPEGLALASAVNAFVSLKSGGTYNALSFSGLCVEATKQTFGSAGPSRDPPLLPSCQETKCPQHFQSQNSSGLSLQGKGTVQGSWCLAWIVWDIHCSLIKGGYSLRISALEWLIPVCSIQKAGLLPKIPSVARS